MLTWWIFFDFCNEVPYVISNAGSKNEKKEHFHELKFSFVLGYL